MDLEQDVKTHTKRVESGERVRYAQACPHCGAADEKPFGLHDCRRRKFRLVIGQYIQVALSWILRWRCLRCGKRFTDYPFFALPRKRFTKRPVLEKANEYLGTDHTYRKTVEDEGMAIVYDDRIRTEKKQPVGLAPSTVWRWLSWLGGMPGTLRGALNLIRQKEPNSTLHRQPWVVPSGKYRSVKRQETLQQAMQLLVADRVCEGLFGEGIFPRYAISQGWS